MRPPKGAPEHRSASAPSTAPSKRGRIASLLLALVFVLVLGGLAVVRHQALHSHGFDLGNYQQVVWTTSRGHWFESSYVATLQSGLRHHLGDHFELILAAIAPFYWLWSGPETLLVLQALCLGATGLALFWFASSVGTGDVGALLVQLLFYLHPAIQGPALFDFHPLVLAPAFLAAALLAAERNRWVSFAVALALALACREQVAVSVAAISLYLAVRKRKPLLAAGVVALALLWLFLTVGWAIPRFHPEGRSKHFEAKFGHLGATPSEAALELLSSPRSTLRRLTEDGRVGYLRQLFSHSGGPLFVLAPEVAVVAAPEVLINLLSRETPQRVIFWQYAATSATFLVAAVALTTARLRRLASRRGKGRWPGWVAPAIVAAACLLSLRAHARGFGGLYLAAPGVLPQYDDGGRADAAGRVFDRIPPQASLAAQSDLAPHLSNRRRIYVFPWMEAVDFIVLDERGETFPLTREEHARLLAELRRDPAFETVAQEDGFVLFRRARPAGALSRDGFESGELEGWSRPPP